MVFSFRYISITIIASSFEATTLDGLRIPKVCPIMFLKMRGKKVIETIVTFSRGWWESTFIHNSGLFLIALQKNNISNFIYQQYEVMTKSAKSIKAMILKIPSLGGV